MEDVIEQGDLSALEALFRSQFLSVSKILELFDQKVAQDFKAMNSYYGQSHQHRGHNCCNESTIHIPKDKMNTPTRLLKEEIIDSKTFFTKENYKHLRAVLEAVNESFSHIV